MKGEKPTVLEFSKYYEETKDGIFNYILYRVGFNRYLAEDLTSDVFLKAWKAFESYDRARSFKTWIFTIAHNHLVNFYVSGKKAVLPLDEAIKITKENSATDQLSTKMDIERILKIVSELPESQREIVIMRYVNDLSNGEIARILGKEEGAVRTALSRSLAAVRDKYSTTYNEKSHGQL